jgi:hypothetical protein
MLAVVAEKLQKEPRPSEEDPLACELTSLQSERFSRAKAERFIGATVTSVEAEIVYGTARPMSLLESLRRAAEGDAEALQSAALNVKTDVIERSIKKGHVTKVTQERDADGNIIQYGQSGRSIQANSLRYASQNPKILPRTKAETRNFFRIEDAARLGLLKDHCIVVPSRPADDMSEEEAHAEGFFVDTMSIALQVTTEGEYGEIITESAFVAGKRNPMAPRHDAELVRLLGARLGISIGQQTATEGIDRPWLVPRRLMPNGVIDVVRLADEAMGTFFGEDRPIEDYLGYLDKCMQRERELNPTVEGIVAQLISESGNFLTPLDATRRLHELSEAALVRRALYDKSIDPNVFGIESAAYIQAARYYLEQGDVDRVDDLMGRAENAADSSSCPGGGGKNRANRSDGNSQSAQSEDSDCEFTSKQCPLCGKKNVHTVVKKLSSGKKYIKGNCGCAKIA